MKGIAHFITGVALATCIPEVVQGAAAGALWPVLGGIAGILPDTLDFKFARYFVPCDREIDPGPDPDPDAVADLLVEMMTTACETGRSRRVLLHTVRLGPDLWRAYAVRFNPAAQELVVEVGAAVSAGGVAYPGLVPSGRRAVRKLPMALRPTYDEWVHIEAFSGPTLLFEPGADGLLIHFLDWHRSWSHSLVLGAGVGVLGAGIGGPDVGWVVALGWCGHVLEDQLGHLGSNLFWPLSRQRMSGLRWIHSGDAGANGMTVWLALALILFNLDRFSGQPMLPIWYWPLVILPVFVVVVGSWMMKRRRNGPVFSLEFYRQAESLAEVEYREIA